MSRISETQLSLNEIVWGTIFRNKSIGDGAESPEDEDEDDEAEEDARGNEQKEAE